MYRSRFARHLAAIILFWLVFVNCTPLVCPPVPAAVPAEPEIDYDIDLAAGGDCITVSGTVRRRDGGDTRLYLDADADVVSLAATAADETPVEARIVFDPALPEKTGLFIKSPGGTCHFVYQLHLEREGGKFGFAYPGDILAVPGEPGAKLRLSVRWPAGQLGAGPADDIMPAADIPPLVWGELRWGEAKAEGDAGMYGFRLYGEMLAAARSGRTGPAEFLRGMQRATAAYRASGGKDEATAAILAACRLDWMLVRATDGGKNLVDLLDTFATDGALHLPDRSGMAVAARSIAGDRYEGDWQEWHDIALTGILADSDGDGRPDLISIVFGSEKDGDSTGEEEGGGSGDGSPLFGPDGGEETPGTIGVTVDGRPLHLDAPPLIAAGRVLVPFRALFETFGVKVGWDAEKELITGTKDGVTLELRPDCQAARVGGVLQRMDGPVRTAGGRSFVPLRFVAETLGCAVDWDEEAAAVTVRTGGRGAKIIVPAAVPLNLPESQAAGSEKVAYLTFDDGPHPSVTPLILETLAQCGVKATFFVVGSNAEKYPALLQRIAAEGHLLGNHTYSHVYSELETSQEAFLAAVTKAEKIIEKITGMRTTVFRAPGGTGRYPALFNQGLYGALQSRGYTTFDWNVTTIDSEYPRLGANRLLENVKYYSRGKKAVIVLMHDAATHGPTAAALPRIIEYLFGEGYAFDVLRPGSPTGK